MSQRDSGYDRVAFDEYATPAWTTRALLPHLPSRVRRILEPACGAGKMLEVLRENYHPVDGYDIQLGVDFFSHKSTNVYDAIVTNPPYNLATEFIERALHLMEPQAGVVAMLLRTDFDHAKSRRHLFADHPAFAKKLVLTKRIVWFEGDGRKAAPSFNHAWFIWDWRNEGVKVLAYDFQGGK